MADTGGYKQPANSPLRTAEGFAAEFGLPYKKKVRRWEVTESGFKKVNNGAGKGDHRRKETAEDRAVYDKKFQELDWNNYPKKEESNGGGR